MSTLQRAVVVIGALTATFLVAFLAPVPTLPDATRTGVEAEVSERLPGWQIQKLDRSWEGAFTVVTTCAGKEVSFQFVPGHGLPPEDAWLHPSNDFARDRLRTLSDHRRYLVWYAEPRRPDSLSCDEELARTGEPPVTARTSD
jgi:hypothetical protein